MKHHLGTGTLTWDSVERQTDRYGAVYLIPDGNNSLTEASSPSLLDAVECEIVDGCFGTLTAVVQRTRKSAHIGDLFHSVFPRTPEVGQKIRLGEGMLKIGKNHDGSLQIELHPADGRSEFWMDIRALYDVHEQTVDLQFKTASTTKGEQPKR